MSCSSTGLQTRPLLCLSSGSVSVWSLKASPSETLLTSSAIVKCDGLAFGAFPGCVTRCFTLTSRFLPPRPAKVTIYATWCRHCLSFFFFWCRKNLGICEATKDHSDASSKNRERRSIWRSLHAALWCSWPSNAPVKDADLNWVTETGHMCCVRCDRFKCDQTHWSVLSCSLWHHRQLKLCSQIISHHFSHKTAHCPSHTILIHQYIKVKHTRQFSHIKPSTSHT